MKLTGKLVYLDPTKDVGKEADKPFLTRQLGLVTEDEVNFKTYKNYYGFQAVNDNCAKFDGLKIDDELEVEFSMRGNLSKVKNVEPTEQNPNCSVIYMSLSAENVKLIKANETAPAAEKATETAPAAEKATEDKPPF